MRARSFDPLRLDVEAFARDGTPLAGQWPIDAFERLRDAQMPGGEAPQPVGWTARGERQQPRVGEPELWLHLQASTRLALQCQRCLQPVDTPLQVDRRIRFVRGEEEAATLDADVDDDVLALTRSLDLRELVEDELLLALPLVPRHEQCPTPLPTPAGEPIEDDARPNPFAVLAGLRGKGGG
jgi:uncharacterized protein